MFVLVATSVSTGFCTLHTGAAGNGSNHGPPGLEALHRFVLHRTEILPIETFYPGFYSPTNAPYLPQHKTDAQLTKSKTSQTRHTVRVFCHLPRLEIRTSEATPEPVNVTAFQDINFRLIVVLPLGGLRVGSVLTKTSLQPQRPSPPVWRLGHRTEKKVRRAASEMTTIHSHDSHNTGDA